MGDGSRRRPEAAARVRLPRKEKKISFPYFASRSSFHSVRIHMSAVENLATFRNILHFIGLRAFM
jgi:hypothetical protein